MEPIKVIGLDCDNPQALKMLPEAEQKLLREADMICGGKTILAPLKKDPALAGRLLPLDPPLEPLFNCLADLVARGMRVVALADGDPLFFGLGSSLARRMPGRDLRIRPAISSLQAACSRMGLPWGEIRCVSLHGREDPAPLFAALASSSPICALTGGQYSPDVLARLLLDRGVDWLWVDVFENMGLPKESRRSMSLEDCALSFFGKAATIIFTPLKGGRKTQELGEGPALGDYSTKPPARGAIMELLAIGRDDVVWDIGSGAGTIALAACRQASRVYAVEEKASRALDIQENRRLAGAANLEIRLGHAPACLADLPEPERIFIGGGLSGRDGMSLLEGCARRLARGGRIAASCLLLDSADLARKFFKNAGWRMRFFQISASSLEKLGSGEYFAPLNPVFLICAQKP